MKTKYAVLSSLFFIIQLVGVLPLRAEHYYFKQISLKEGLPSNVRCILRDEQGFVWIGTKSGLGKFDGHELKRYKHQANDPNSLLHNLVYQIAEDKQHNIWVLTEKGIARYQQQSNDFTFPTDEDGKNITAYSFCLVPDGILFGGKDRIYKYSYDDSSLRLLQYFNANSFKINALSMWDSKTLLCCSRWTGIYLVDLHTGEHRRPPFDCGPEITTMMTDSRKRIWIAPYSGGLRCYSYDGKLLASYSTRNSALSNDIVLSLAEREGQLWIGTDGGGINILTPETGEISQLEYIPGRENYSLPANSILCLHNDHNNNIWAGSTCNGLISIREVFMKTYTDVVPGNDRGLSNSTVRSLYRQSPDSIWIGTDGGGINLFNPRTEKFTHYLSTWNDKIAFISGFTPGKLLISLFSKGVFVFNPATGEKQPFTIVDKETTTQLCNRGKSVNLYQNTPNTVLLLGDHVYQYHLKEKKFDKVTGEEGKSIVGTLVPFKHENNRTYINDFKHIYELHDGDSLLQTTFECYQDTVISSASHDEHGDFWIGSNFGLIHYNPVSQKQTHILTNLFTEVNMVQCDQRGKVWIGADNLLFAWLIQEQKFVLFGESNGAIQNEYLPNARLVNNEGDVYIGGVKGMLRIDGQLLLNTSEMPELQLLDIIINGEPAQNKLYSHPAAISVPWDSNITIRIMSKEEDIFRKKVYRYRIEGLNDQYIESYQPELVIRSLPPGNYKIMASCTAKDGSWIPNQKILELTVLPPWYRTWWFILGCTILIATIIIETFRRTLKRNQEKLKWAMKEHEKQMYEEKVRFLINISHELRTPLTLIHAPLNQILKSLSSGDSQYLPLKAIYRQAQRMKNLINMVLDVRKMEVGESKLQIQPHPLNQWIEHVSQDFISEGEAKNVHIRYQLDPRIEKVSFDKDKCEIILSNLLINALKHSPQDTEITIASELLPEENRVRISSASHDEHGDFWIGSNFGLIHYNPVSQKQTHILTNLFTEVNMVQCDQRGKVWIGADNLLFAWLIQEQKFVLFGESNGAIQNEYLPNARLVNNEGDVYIGGVKGMLRIDGQLLLNTSEMPELQLLDIIINGEPAQNKLYSHPAAISVPWDSNITIRIMSKEEDIFRKKVYRYRIEGLNDQYIESYQPELVIRSLPPGNYKIMASCTAKDGSWIPNQKILELTVLPPWYRTWWFILGCTILIATIIIETFRRTLKRNQEKLKWAMKEHEKQMYEEKVRFLINISHELRTPLTLIHAPLNQILKSLSSGDSQYLPLKAIYRQAQRMKNLINMVLDVRKMEVGESKLQIQPHPLNQWIEHVSQDFISEGEAKNVHIRYQLDPRIEKVSFDKDKCEIILSNLLINALKHSPQDTEITIASELLPEENRVRISVIDQGCGLKQVDTHKLFTRFYQGTGEQSGTGIGLSYSKILVELHGGSIGAQDNEETGASFFFELPLRQEPEEIICEPKAYLNELMMDDNSGQPSAKEVFDTTPYTILVVDDNPDMTDFLKRTFEGYFKRIIIAGDGVEALQLVRSHVPDIIVSDVMMPRMNGYKLCKTIKEDINISHIPVILLTARDDRQSQISGYKNGADGYLSKPFEVEMLMELIRNRLKNREYTKKRYLNAGLIPTPEESTISLTDETFLIKLNSIIQENIENSNLGIQFICQEVGLGRSSLYNKLKALTGMGANEYISKLRIEKAITLISGTDMPFSEIAEKTGFTTPSYFSTAFKQYTGETPSQYKERKKKGLADK